MATSSKLVESKKADHALVEQAQRARRAHRTRFFDHYLPFSWSRLLGILLSYLLVCSDIPRAGLGVQNLAKYPVLEPNAFEFYGPWFYSVQSIRQNETHLGTSKVWSYKFDTTSIVWRAFAQFYQLKSFPSCFLYTHECENVLFNRTVGFQFLNEMVEATKKYASRSHTTEPVAIALRTKSNYLDRFHHYILPQLFVNPVWRTNQALYYPPPSLISLTNSTTQYGLHERSLCYHHSGIRPFFCDDVWINYQRSCPSVNKACQQIGLIWVDTLRRLLQLQLKYPTFTVDLTILSGQEDVQMNKGGIVSVGRRKADVSTIMRVLDCSKSASMDSTSCDVVYIDDYRYEGAVFTTNAMDWYHVVATLRAVGQTYFFLRILLLFLSCFVTRRSEEAYANQPLRIQLKATISLFLRIPSQCLIYGSSIPVAFYAAAHFIDATMTYEIIAQQFTTPLGQFKLNFTQFVFITATQMRNVWFLAFFLHLSVHYLLTTRSHWVAPTGILGVPEFSLGLLSSLSVFTQFRSLSFRNSKVLSIQRIEAHASSMQATRRADFFPNGGGNMLLEGVILDFKFFLCLICITMALMVILRLWLMYGYVQQTTRTQERVHPSSLVLARLAVPYSAGSLWPTVALSVNWGGDLFPKPTSSQMLSRFSSHSIAAFMRRTWTTVTKHQNVNASPSARSSMVAVHDWPEQPCERLQFLQKEMENVHLRRGDIDAIVALMNLVMLSDPWTFFRLRMLPGALIHYFHDPTTGKIFALPASVLSRAGQEQQLNLPLHQWIHTSSMRTRNMAWSELIHVG